MTSVGSVGRWIPIVLLLCSAACGGSGSRLPGAGGSIVGGSLDVKKMTALIKVTPPKSFADTLDVQSVNTVAGQLGVEPRALGELLLSVTAGASGSGFVVVVRRDGRVENFVVTNRHVIDESQTADLSFPDGQQFNGCDIVYADRKHDLAVLSFPDGAKPFEHGLAIAAKPVEELQTVVATGYPGMMGKPSYRATEGKVSNTEFKMEGSDDPAMFYIEHTAAIDPGNSGGPLTSETKQVLGVNTLLLKDKHSAFYAVPAQFVRDALATALDITINRGNGDWMKRQLVQACKVFTSELSSSSPKISVVEDLVSNQYVAGSGWADFQLLLPNLNADMKQALVNVLADDPMKGLRRAVLIVMMVNAKTHDGFSPNIKCTGISPTDEENISQKDATVRMLAPMGKGNVELVWTFEHGQWRITGMSNQDK